MSCEEVQPLTPSVSISIDPMLARKLAAPENTENLDRPSPVSVLEPFYSEEVNSPERPESDQGSLPLSLFAMIIFFIKPISLIMCKY